MTNGEVTTPPEPKWLFYILSFLIPIFGLIMGIIYQSRIGDENKHFGKMCIIMFIINLVLVILCWIISVVHFPLFAITAPVTY